MKVRGGRKRESVLKLRQEDHDENFETWERMTGLPGGFVRPGSQQKG